jgi:hypothetical protein
MISILYYNVIANLSGWHLHMHASAGEQSYKKYLDEHYLDDCFVTLVSVRSANERLCYSTSGSSQ